MSDTDTDTDALYQLPLGDFTAARNALAKTAGADGAAIKALEKPTLPAWAVNQIFWRQRDLWDALVAASTAVRQAHVAVISGRKGDVAGTESAHAAALRTATDAARQIIEAGGEHATPATMAVVVETLQALPSSDAPGRLSRPLKPLGFSALMDMGIPVVHAPVLKGHQAGSTTTARGSRKPDSKAARAEAKAKAAARKAAEKLLRTAEAAEAKADLALADAQKALAAAERELDRVRDRLVFLEKQRNDAETHLRQKSRARQEAANARVQAAQDLDALPE